jgi:hypothetical protein
MWAANKDYLPLRWIKLLATVNHAAISSNHYHYLQNATSGLLDVYLARDGYFACTGTASQEYARNGIAHFLPRHEDQSIDCLGFWVKLRHGELYLQVTRSRTSCSLHSLPLRIRQWISPSHAVKRHDCSTEHCVINLDQVQLSTGIEKQKETQMNSELHDQLVHADRCGHPGKGMRDPHNECCIIGNFDNTSTWYILKSPWFTCTIAVRMWHRHSLH